MVLTGRAFAFISSPGRSPLVAALAFRCTLTAPGFSPFGLLIVPFGPLGPCIVCVARLFPAAVLSLPPRLVAPVVAKRPRLSRTYFLAT